MVNENQANDWRIVFSAYSNYMFHESAERGYDAAAARAANLNYYAQKASYEKKYLDLWNPEDRAKFDKPALEKPPATRGHNNPPSETELLLAELKERYGALIEDSEKMARKRPAAIQNDDYAQKVTGFLANITARIAELEKIRKKEKEPFKTKAETVDGYFKIVKTELERSKALIQAPLTKYLEAKRQAEQKARMEAAEKLRIEAEAQKVASHALYDAGAPMEAGEARRAGAKIEKYAERLEVAATKTGAEIAQVKTDSGASASLRKRIVAEITDIKTLDLEKLRPFLKTDELQRALNALAATGVRECAGAKIYETTEAAVRR